MFDFGIKEIVIWNVWKFIVVATFRLACGCEMTLHLDGEPSNEILNEMCEYHYQEATE